jgi:multidrug resistance protein, MATE family
MSSLNTTHSDDAIERGYGIRRLTELAWPIMVNMLSMTAMLVTDTIFVSQLGTEALAAIGLATSVMFLIYAFAMGFLRGAKVIVAQRTGAGDEIAVERALWQTLWLAGIMGLVAWSVAPFGSPIMSVFGSSAEVRGFAATYVTIRLLGAPLAFVMTGISCWFEGRGDTRTPMLAALIANGANIALDPLLIFGFGPIPAMGIGGAAVATILGVSLAVIFLVWRLGGRVCFTFVGRGIDAPLLRAIVRVGAPMALRGLSDVGAWIVFMGFLALVGDAALAAHVMVARIISVSFLPGYAIGEAASVLVGHALGAGVPEGATRAWRSGCWLALAFMSSCGVIFLTMPEWLMAPFEPSEAVAVIGAELLLIGACFQLVDAFTMVTLGVLNGAGDTRFTLVSSMVCSWVLNLPLAWFLIFDAGMGAAGAWSALTLEITALTVIGVWRVRSGRWLAVGLAEVARGAAETAAAREEAVEVA